MSWLELRVPPLLQLVLLGLGMTFAALVLPRTWVLDGSLWLALLLGISGVFICLAGVYSFRRFQTTVDPRYPSRSSALVTAGIYRYSRNPMYLGMLLLLAAWAVYLERLVSFAALPVFVIYMRRFQILPEERHMAAQFGNDYLQYKNTVRQWL